MRDGADSALQGQCGGGGPVCVQRLCEAEVQLRVAHELLSFARIVAPEEFRINENSAVTIPPQSTATNAGLAELAGLEAQGASYSAFDALWQHRLNSGGGSCLPAELPAPDGGTLDGQVYAANILAEAYLLATGEAHETMGEFTTAVADAYFSDEALTPTARPLAPTARPLTPRPPPPRVGTQGAPILR